LKLFLKNGEKAMGFPSWTKVISVHSIYLGPIKINVFLFINISCVNYNKSDEHLGSAKTLDYST
jgi:hypothetical protein